MTLWDDVHIHIYMTFFRAVWGSQQHWVGDTEVSHITPPHTHASPPPLSTSPTRGVHLLQLVILHWHNYHPKHSVHSMGLDKYITTWIHHYSTIQSSFTALKILCAHLSLSTNPGNHWFFTVSIVLPFPECHIAEIIPVCNFSRLVYFP